jgi:hypothetical protein
MALVIVVCVMALAAVLSYALLSSAAIQATASANGMSAAIAEAQAESGVHLAMYYLLNPTHAPTLTNGYWPGADNITFATTGSSATQMAGSVSVSVTNPSTNIYDVISVGSSGASNSIGAGVVTRTISLQITVGTSYLIQQAGIFNGNSTIGKNVTITSSGDAIQSSGTVTINNSGAIVSGNILAPGLVGPAGQPINGSWLATNSASPAPTLANINDYITYTYQGQTYNATPLSSGTISSSSMPSVNPVSNPLNVYYLSSGDITLTGNVSLTGTLVAVNGNLIVQGASNAITAPSGMPAMVIGKQLIIKNANAGLAVNGVVYANTGVSTSGNTTGSSVTVNGALLISSGNITPNTATMQVTYNSTYTSVPALTTTDQTPVSVKITSWSP